MQRRASTAASCAHPLRIFDVPCRVTEPPTLACGQGVVKIWGVSCSQAAARSRPQISDRPGCLAAPEGGAGRGRRDHLQISCAPYRNPPTGCLAAGVAGGTVDGRWPTWRLACSPAPTAAHPPQTPRRACVLAWPGGGVLSRNSCDHDVGDLRSCHCGEGVGARRVYPAMRNRRQPRSNPPGRPTPPPHSQRPTRRLAGNEPNGRFGQQDPR